MFDAIKFGVGIVTKEEFSSFNESQLTYDYVWKYNKKPKNEKGSPTGKLPFFLTVISKRKMKKFMHLQNRSKKISTETVSSCLRRSICPTTVSTDVLTVRTI